MCIYTTGQFFFFKVIDIFIEQGYIKLIKMTVKILK